MMLATELMTHLPGNLGLGEVQAGAEVRMCVWAGALAARLGGGEFCRPRPAEA